MARRLLLVAERSNRDDGGSASRRRAVSTAYYAVFHALACLCADELLGADAAARESVDYGRVYRALEHGSMKAKFQKDKSSDPDAIRQIGERFVFLQSKRHDADYRPQNFHFTKADCTDLIESARSAVELVERLAPAERRAFAVRLLIKDRSI